MNATGQKFESNSFQESLIGKFRCNLLITKFIFVDFNSGNVTLYGINGELSSQRRLQRRINMLIPLSECSFIVSLAPSLLEGHFLMNTRLKPSKVPFIIMFPFLFDSDNRLTRFHLIEFITENYLGRNIYD